MASIKLKINDKNYTVEVDPKMPLLWAIRDIVGLTGNKVRMWHRTVWRLHRTSRRKSSPLMLNTCHGS
jgi:hypothetical protein